MAGEDAVWHVAVDGAQRGPLTKSEVLELLRSRRLTGSDLVWGPGLSDWTPVGETSEFLQPPSRTAPTLRVDPRPQPGAALAAEPDQADKPSVGTRWSLWRSASIGLLVSALLLLVQIGNGRGFELANYAHTRSAGTIAALLGQVLAAPLIFVLAALVRNLLRKGKSSASAARGALTFAVLLIGIFAALFAYSAVFFSSSDVISGETRKAFVAGLQGTCAQRQRSLGQAVTDAQIQSYCSCVGEKMADGTTYKQLGSELDASALAGLRQKTEAAGQACR
jgi:hypothetical protein